ncbi:hypothetical protein OG394_29315 [Kribbella sp. NBC_01245]|uniref:hypothetical protein n=1 Tax=Kribbella sp. NBC_01245 TaxID=2903578 RepID=UPI002E286D94|nr:hypothetical protein [Kribbella sp. NBC_01245]
MRQISRLRFDALAAYTRSPLVATLSHELGWFEWPDSRLIAALLVDTDDEYSAVILAPDLNERFRWIAMTHFHSVPEQVLPELAALAEGLAKDLDEVRQQGDEQAVAMDLFAPVRPAERLHPDFLQLSTHAGYGPARALIEPMMRWHEDGDGNFVEQFQTTGFDTRMWELYLFAVITEAGLVLDRTHVVPDFVGRGPNGDVCIEATSINPSRDRKGQLLDGPPRDTPESQQSYVQDYLPIRYAGPLTAKLSKRYWEQPHVDGKPLIFAIQDFQEPLSMTWTRSALPTYLYGMAHEPHRRSDGSLEIRAVPVASHTWGSKEVQSGFFSLPGAENVSAVLFNSSGTISKFNRMGVAAGFGPLNVTLIRRGVAADPDPNASEPTSFVHIVGEGYPESWIEGTDVYHNPHATHPLDPEMLPGAAHHRLMDDGQVETTAPRWQPLSSVTSIVVLPDRSADLP